jgi:Ca-activated chloride channel family protein
MEHLNPNRYDNAMRSSSYMEGASNKQKFFIPLRRTELTGQISGPISEFRLVQTFHFTKEECPETVDAIYRFPLPGDAAILSVKAVFGSNQVEAKLMER